MNCGWMQLEWMDATAWKIYKVDNYTLNHTENKMMSFDSFNYFTRNSEMDVNFSVENSLKKEESSLKKDSFNNLSILSPESVRILSL